MRFFLFAILLIGLSACEGQKVLSDFDNTAFQTLGVTFFDRPQKATMKQIHLDRGMMVGQSVMVSGKVVDVGAYETFVVLNDETARMLVVLTELDSPRLLREVDIRGLEVRILGTVDYGKKGLPFVLARSVVLGTAANSEET